MRRNSSGLTVIAAGVLALAGGCSDPVGPPAAIEELPRALSVAEQDVIDASNTFAFDLLREAYVRTDSPNVVLSPLSASMALGMTMNGADGATYDEMHAMLGFGAMTRDEVNHAYRDILDLLLDLDPSVEIAIANSTWAREGFPFLPAFYETITTYFDAEAHVLDFSRPDAPDVINAWVDEQTNGRIDGIIDQIDGDAIMFLLNAVYFKGDWRTQFDPAKTRPAPFQLDGGTSVQVQMMTASDMPVRLGHVDGVQVAELPYGGDAFTMVVALPPEGTPVTELVATLDRATWEGWMASLGELHPADVSVPRFEIEFEQTLNQTLQALGMEAAFDDGRADFSRLTDASGVFVKAVKQKTFMRVDEVGTEAAAVTSVEMGVTSVGPNIRLDRPFLLAIRERHSGTILFTGVIGDPH